MGGILHRNQAAGNQFVGNVTGSGHFAARSAKPVQVIGGPTEQPVTVMGAKPEQQTKPAHLAETAVTQVITPSAKAPPAHLAPPITTTGPTE